MEAIRRKKHENMRAMTFLVLVLFSLVAVAQERWDIKDDYVISFSGTKAEGTFRGLSGDISFDASDLDASTFDVSVEVATISTGNNTKDKHARGDSWFDAIAYPEMHFVSKQITQLNNNEFEVTGDLKLKGITKDMKIRFSFTSNGRSGLFVGTMDVNRNDFGIEGNFFGFVVGEVFEVALRIPVEAASN